MLIHYQSVKKWNKGAIVGYIMRFTRENLNIYV